MSKITVGGSEWRAATESWMGQGYTKGYHAGRGGEKMKTVKISRGMEVRTLPYDIVVRVVSWRQAEGEYGWEVEVDVDGVSQWMDPGDTYTVTPESIKIIAE